MSKHIDLLRKSARIGANEQFARHVLKLANWMAVVYCNPSYAIYDWFVNPSNYSLRMEATNVA